MFELFYIFISLISTVNLGYVYEYNLNQSIEMESLVVVHPSQNVTINGANHNVWGQSIPSLPLFLNGEEVENRTPEGFFSIFYPLEQGENYLVFSQPGQDDVERIIFRGVDLPQQATTQPATPSQIQQAVAPIDLYVFAEDQFVYAIVTSYIAWLFPNSSTVGGSNVAVERGMIDRVIARRGNWLHLSNGYWIQVSNVSIIEEEFSRDYELGEIVVIEDYVYQIKFKFVGDYTPMARLSFDAETNSLTAYFGMQTTPPNIDSIYNSIFYSIYSGTNENGISYITFTIDERYHISGFDFKKYQYNWLSLNIKTPRSLSDTANKPFYGFTFVIDPGHGGRDHGALGPMGTRMSEKHIVLDVSEKIRYILINLGADVVMTRYSNFTDLTLNDRVVTSRTVRPDMFLSIHGNSVPPTTNATNVRGFTIWSRNPNSYRISRTILDRMYDINPYTNRNNNVNIANFYVTRPTWAPHTLLEISFLSNIHDFVWMIDTSNQYQVARYTILSLIDYFQ